MSNFDRHSLIETVSRDLRTLPMDSISSLDGKKISKAIFLRERPTDWLKLPVSRESVTAFTFGRILAFQLKELGFPWKIMSQVWVEIMCHVAIRCRPNVYAQQSGKGGQLLTLVWLLMNSLGLGSLVETREPDIGDGNESTILNDIGHGHEPTNPNELLDLLLGAWDAEF
ncbi:hypothetical protein SLA2020_359530 [Shorea laevis]